jgi:hypothetical protein
MIKSFSLRSKCDLSSVVNKNAIGNPTTELPIIPDPPIKQHTKSSYNLPIFRESFTLSSMNDDQPISVDDVKEKRKLIIYIKNYLREFPSCLTEFKNIDYNSKSIQQLQNYIEEIKMCVCHSNSGSILLGVFQGGCDVLETLAPIVSFDLTGLKYVATKNPNVIASVKELSLEYQNLNYISPEKRLALLMFQMCYALNSMNKANKKVDDKLSKDLPDTINEKYSDL